MKMPPGVYQRGQIYWITYMLNGKQRFESSHSHDLRVAVALLQMRKADIAQGRITISPSQAPLLSELLQSYIGQIENPNTAKRYRLSGDKLVEVVGDRSIVELSPFMFDRFKDIRIKAGVTPAGVNRELALARASLNVAVERRLIPYSPFAGVKLFNEANHRKPPRALSYADEKKVLGSCDLRLCTITSFLLESGERVGEALATRWVDVDFDEATVTVVHSKTAAGRRVIPMTSLCKSVLLAWQSATVGMSDYVFFNPQNPTVHIRSVKTAWRNALKSAGLSHFPLYACRHSFATRLAAAGVSDAIIDQLLGHSRRDILSHYTARVPEYLRDAISRLEDLRHSKEGAIPSRNGSTSLPSRSIAKGSNLIQ